MKDFFCGLDIGSSTIKFLVVRKTNRGELELILKGEEIAQGIKKGVIIDPKKVSQILEDIAKKISRETKKAPPPAFVNLGGSQVFSTISKGLISVSRADQKISEEDLERVLKAAQAINLGPNKEILDIVPIKYIIDGQEEVQDPIGLKGLRLEVEALVIGGFSGYFENLKKAFLNSEFEVLDFIPSPLALSSSVLKEREKEIGVCLLNIGAETTEISVFEDGKLIFFSVIPFGALSVTNKIAIFLKSDFEIAERVKIELGSCFSKGKRERVEIEGENLRFTKSSLSKEIREGYSKIFDQVKKELKKISKDKKLPGGIVLTGGGAKMKGLEEFARQKFKLNSRIGGPKGILGLEEDPTFSLCAGLILLGIEQQKELSSPGFFSRLLQFFKNFLP